MNKFLQSLFILAALLVLFGSELSAQNSKLVQTGIDSYNDGDYGSALNTFNSAIINSEQLEPTVGVSSESDVSASNETDVSVSKESDMGASEETDAKVSKETTMDASAEKYMSVPLNNQGSDLSSLYLYRGRTNYKLGYKEAALEDFDKAIELNPKQTDAYFRRALMNRKVNPEKVCPDLLTAISQGHESAKELYNLICK